MDEHAPTPQTLSHRSLKAAAIIAGLAIVAIPAGVLLAQDGAAFTIAETGQSFAQLQDAVDTIGDGAGTIEIAAGTYRQCAVQAAGTVAYVANAPGSAIFDGQTCEGKAALVLCGREANVAGLVFQNMSVPDYNGAGIRLEQGNLTVVQSWFRDSQQGILTANDHAGRIVVDKTTFSGLGTCEGSGGCAHSIYVGDYGSLRISRSRFEKGTGGHYVKARAANVEVLASSFDDSQGRGTNYMIDLPAGSAGAIRNNWFVQGADKENYSAFIAVGAEQNLRSSDGLQIAGNDARLAPKVQRNTIFVADWSGAQLTIGDNALGRGLTRFERR
ncbi:MAG: right-handed parallel beta-helix repeat-containing protein [Pontixanthobacter sp.]